MRCAGFALPPNNLIRLAQAAACAWAAFILATRNVATLFILNGPNLNLLGKREPGIYGAAGLAEVESRCRDHAAGFQVEFRQTNSEGMLVDWIQEASQSAGIILNAGAFTHTSIAVHDALRAVEAPVIEVHLSNVFARESFRHHSYVSPVANGVICGFGVNSYILAIDAIIGLTNS
jgi:3-dehydroquinate dehydratase-2